MTVYGGKKYKPKVDIGRADFLKQSCYPSFIVSKSLEFGDF